MQELLTRKKGILIRMFFRDIEKHKLPHIHAEYQSAETNPAWIEIHKDDLLADWELVVNGKPPFKIKGLDQ